MHEGYIICNNDTKNMILKTEAGLKNFKFFTPSMLKDMLYGSFKPDSIIFLFDNFKINIPEALEIIKYLPLVDINKEYKSVKLRGLVAMKKALMENDYFIYDPKKIEIFKRYPVTFINPLRDKLLDKLINRLEEVTEVYFSVDLEKYPLANYYSYSNMELEAYNAFLECKRILKENKQAQFYFLNTSSEYYSIFKRLSNSFKISINLKSDLSIVSNPLVKNFLKGLKEKTDFNTLINEITDDEIKNYIIGIINKYNLDLANLSNYTSLFSYLFRNKSYKANIYDKAIRLGNIFDSYNENDYVFLFNFNQNFPNLVKDEAYLNKNDLNELDLDDYISQNALNRSFIIKKLNSIKNLKVSFPQRFEKSKNILSELGSALNLKEIEGKGKALGISPIEDTLSLASMLDDYMQYGIYDEALGKYNLEGLNYQKFDNTFKPFSEEFKLKHQPKLPIKMSYSNVKIYYSCPFNYYLDRILKLAKFEGNMATKIGSYAHKILEESYLPDFDFSESKARGKEILNKKEQFYATLMDEVLKDILAFNHKKEKLMALTETLCEHEFKTLKTENEDKTDAFDQDINFYGYIDKIKYKIIDDKVYVAIYDYKTGGDVVDLSNIVDGENLQLPSYLFLLNKDSLFKDKKVIVVGMYLQKVNVTLIDGLRDKLEQREASFKLKGYSTMNKDDLSLLDPYYSNSTYIQSMKTTKNGEFSSYTKLYNEKSITNLLKIVPDLLEKLKKAIYEFDFPIAPLRVDNKSNSCTFCQYKKICYKTEKDYNDKTKKPFKGLMEEDYHGLD